MNKIIENEKEITMIYKVIKNENKIKILWADFVKNYKKVCKIIYKGKELKLDIFFDIENNYDDDILEIKLKGIDKITDFSFMFFECKSLLCLPDFYKLNDNHIADMSYMFSGCSSLKKINDISEWNTSNVTNMRNIFNKCTSLQCLPDISKWDISNCNNLSE